MIATTFKPIAQMTFTTVEVETKRLVAYCRTLTAPTLIIDISGVVNCDSAGLALLIHAKRLAYKHKKKCQIVGMTSTIQALAQFCGLEKILVST